LYLYQRIICLKYYLYQNFSLSRSLFIAISKLQHYGVVDDRKLTSIKLAHSENSWVLFLYCRKRKEAKNRKNRQRRTDKRRKGKVHDLVREKVSTFAMTLSVVDNASAVRECLCRSFFFSCGEILPVSSIVPETDKIQSQLNS